ncbi:MAG TPA: hypothetical protein VHB97_23910, partial [Polyangia bacterium]|nr:hypothetical protein [Polyangia bacterium]
ARLLAGGVLWLFCNACLSVPVGKLTTTTSQDTPIHISLNQQNKVDILFMVDNSSSMAAMQDALTKQFGKFLGVFSDLAHPTDGSTPQFADLHIGVVTSDYGAGSVGEGNCQATPGGQRGISQATAAASSANAGCAGPTSGLFIQYQFNASGTDVCNLPGGACTADALNSTFTCMASVGDAGCGFEHQLESVYAALHDSTDNAGFLRDDALLAVVFVTNEDDGSAAPGTTFYDADTAGDPNAGAFDTYRQTRFGIECGSPLTMAPETASNGMLTCEPGTEMGAEYPISRYTDFFTKAVSAGGLKSDPSSIILVGLDAPDDDIETISVKPNTGCGAVSTSPTAPCVSAVYQNCGPTDTGCLTRLKHSCQNGADPRFFGDPALRINNVIRAVNPPAAPAQPAIFSICGQDQTVAPDYTSTLQAVAQRIVSQLKPPCIPAPLTNFAEPDCVVEDVTTIAGVEHPTQFKRCDTVGNVAPCYTVVEDAADCACVQGADGVQHHPSIQIMRDMPVPANTVVKVDCATEALLDQSCH